MNKNKKILVLGGAGFLGSTLCSALKKKNEKVIAFDRCLPDDYKKMKGIEWVQGDFCAKEEILDVMKSCDRIYHLVSSTIPSESNADPIYDCTTNVISTLNLLEAMRISDARKILFISSGGTVYGNPERIPINEETPTNPICAYGIGKLAIEKYLSLFYLLHGIEYIALRVSNPYGERQKLHGSQGAVGVFLGKALKGEKIQLWGDGKIIRDYIHADDVARAMISAMESEIKADVINIGSGTGKNLLDIISYLEKYLDKNIDVEYFDPRIVDVPINILDISKAKEKLGWSPQISLENGIKRMIEHFL